MLTRYNQFPECSGVICCRWVNSNSHQPSIFSCWPRPGDNFRIKCTNVVLLAWGGAAAARWVILLPPTFLFFFASFMHSARNLSYISNENFPCLKFSSISFSCANFYFKNIIFRRVGHQQATNVPNAKKQQHNKETSMQWSTFECKSMNLSVLWWASVTPKLKSGCSMFL